MHKISFKNTHKKKRREYNKGGSSKHFTFADGDFPDDTRRKQFEFKEKEREMDRRETQ